MLISYYANKKSSPRLPSWQPSLIFFNIPIESGSIIKPCTLKHFQVAYRLHKAGYWTTWLCVLNMTDHQVTLKRNIELGCAVETDVLVVPREESNGGEQNKAVADVYLRGPVQDSEQEGLKVCSIKVSGDQETGLVMEDATTVEQDGKASSEPGGAVEQSGEMGEGHEQESVEISGKGNPEHKVAAGLSYVTELSAGTLAEEDPSVVHKSNKEVNQPHQAETRELPEHLQDLFDRRNF